MIFRFLRDWNCPNYEEDDYYRAERGWMQNLDLPNEIPQAEEALSYAKELYDETNRANQMIDQKAAEIVRTAGAVAALLTLGLALIGQEHAALILPSFIALAIAIAIGTHVQRPGPSPLPPTARSKLADTIADGGNYPDRMRAFYAAGYHAATAGFKPINAWKAARTADAARWLSLAFVLLLLPLIADLSCRSTASDPVGAGSCSGRP